MRQVVRAFAFYSGVAEDDGEHSPYMSYSWLCFNPGKDVEGAETVDFGRDPEIRLVCSEKCMTDECPRRQRIEQSLDNLSYNAVPYTEVGQSEIRHSYYTGSEVLSDRMLGVVQPGGRVLSPAR